MSTDLYYLVYATILTWVMIMTASLLRSRGWTPSGMKVAFGNRADVPEASPMVARAERAARNMAENLPLFLALVTVAHLGGAASAREQIELCAALFFWARLVYFPVYLAGVPYLRTAIWSVSVAGMGLIAAALIS